MKLTPPQLEDVPTVPELAERGLARVIERNKQGTFYQLTAEGQALLNEIMMRNGAKGREYEQQRAQLKVAKRRRARAAASSWAADAFSEDTPSES